MPQRLRVFISSPTDVSTERRRAALVIEKLAKDYARFFDIEFILWETEPMLASGHFQDNVIPPSEADILILIVWSRLGTALPQKTDLREYRGIDGRVPVTGTEWEFEDALRARQQKGAPDLLAYKKDIPPRAEYSSEADLQELGRQMQLLEAFWNRHFVNRGEVIAAFGRFAQLDEFEQILERDLRSLIERRVASLHAEAHQRSAPVWLKGSPFRGLETYRIEHAPIFFGRSAITRMAVERLVENAEAGHPFLLVLGASGAGKSSLAQAGIVPTLSTRGVVSGIGQWQRAVMRPGGHSDGLFTALASALTGDDALPELLQGHDLAGLARYLETAASGAAFPIGTALTARETQARAGGELLSYEQVRLVLIIDQIEELFTLGDITAEQRTAFLVCIQSFMRSGRVFVIATMRSDYWHRVVELSLLAELADGRGGIDVLPPTRAEIAEMIRRPAEAAGLAFEADPTSEVRLDAALAEQAAHEPGALPLLSFLLDGLYEKDVREGNRSTLTFASMRELGGLNGAIAQRAEAAFTALAPEVQAAFPKVLRALVRVSRSGAEPTARRAAMARFPEGSGERRIVDALLDPQVRLLVAEGDGEGARVRLAHEALITHWERAKRQIAQDRDDLRTLSTVEESESEWRSAEEPHKRGYLLRDPQLANALDLVKRWETELPDELRAFISASAAAAKSAVRRRRVIAAAIMVLLAAAAVVSAIGFYRAETQRDAALAARRTVQAQRNQALIAQSLFLVREAHTATVQGNATLGALLALAALPRSLDNAERPFLRIAEHALAEAIANRRERFIFQGATAAVFSPDGTRIALNSNINDLKGGVRELRDAKTGALIVSLQVANTGSKSKPGEFLFGGPLRDRSSSPQATAFSPDGTRLLTGVLLWDGKTGAPIAELQGHEETVNSVAFSADGSRVATAAGFGVANDFLEAFAHTRLKLEGKSDFTVRIWDGRTGAPILVLRGHQDSVASAAFSPDATRIVSASLDNTARIWDATSGRQIVELRHNGPVGSAIFSKDGTRVLTASDDKTARIWDARTGRQLAVLQHPNVVSSVAFSPDGARIVTAALDKTVRLWDSRTAALVATNQSLTDTVYSVVFSAGGALVLAASQDGTTIIWDTKADQIPLTLKGHIGGIERASFSPDESQILTVGGGTAHLWSVEPTAVSAVLRGHAGPVQSIMFSSDGGRVITQAEDDSVRIWEVAQGGLLLTLRGHTDKVTSATFSADDEWVATGSLDKTARIWNAKTGALRLILKGHTDAVTTVRFSPDGNEVLTVSKDKTGRLWNTETGREVAVLKSPDPTHAVVDGAYSRDGSVLAVGFDYGIIVYDNFTREEIARFPGLLGSSSEGPQIALSPDGSRLIKVGRILDVKTRRQIAELTGTSFALSLDGSRLLTYSTEADLWDIATGAKISHFFKYDCTYGSAGALSPSNSYAVIIFGQECGDRTENRPELRKVEVWDSEIGAPVVEFRGHTDQVQSVAWSPDGEYIISGGRDRTARIWKLPPRCQALIDAARKELPRELSAGERALYFLTEPVIGQSAVEDDDEGGPVTGDICREKSAVSDPSRPEAQRELYVTYGKIGDSLLAEKKPDEAAEVYKKSLDIVSSLLAASPNSTELKRALSAAFDRLGDAYADKKMNEAALNYYESSRANGEALVIRYPTDTSLQRDLSYTYSRIGDALSALKKYPEALAAQTTSLAMRKKLLARDPNNSTWLRDVAVAELAIGEVLEDQKKLDEALAAFRESLEVRKGLAAKDSSNGQWQRDLSVAYNSIGRVLAAQKKLNDALSAYRDCLEIRRALAAKDSENKQWQNDLQSVIADIGGLAYDLVIAREFAVALGAADQAIALAPKEIWMYTNRAHALMFLGRVDEAKALYLQYRGQKNVQDDKSWEAVVLEDFSQMRKAGLTHPLMDTIERQFAAAG